MKHYKWMIVALAFLGTVINYLDRSALAYAITPIQKTFHLNNADFGFIASGFGFGYIIMTLIGGILIDRYGAHKIWTLAALLWSGVSIIFGMVSGLWMFFILRFFLGIAEGPAFPAFTRVVTDWLSIKERARALAAGLAAVPFALLIGAPLISMLIIKLNWRVMFFILGGLGLAWAIAWWLCFKDKPSEPVNVTTFNHQVKNKEKTSWRFMLLNPSLLSNNYAFFSFGYLLFFAMTWLPGYFEQVYHLHLSQVAIFLTLPWAIGAILMLCGGFLSDWLWAKTKSIRVSRSHIIWVCQLLSAFCFIPVILFHSLHIAIIFISLGVGFGLMPNAAFYAVNSDLASDRAATSLGIMDCGFALSGILAPAITGYLSHILGGFGAAFGLLVILSVSSAIGVFIWQRPK